METTSKSKSLEIMEMQGMSKKISQKEIEDFLNESKNYYNLLENIKFEKIELIDVDDDIRNVRVTFQSSAMIYTELEILKGQNFPKHSNHCAPGISIPKPKEDDLINYEMEYDKLLIKEYKRELGSDGMVFTNHEVIDKQRAVAGYLVKNIGLNLIKGKSVMNISLPINIFDSRSILELFAWQNAYAAILLEEAGKCSSPLEKIKYTTAFAVTKFHLSGAQLKPFNPILGETFQCKIKNTNVYCEQTCHHPPIMNFYGIGENYKFFGYNESEASTGANSVKVYYKGNFDIEFTDGTKHRIIYPNMKLAGTMMGSRSLKFRGQLLVVDQKNDLIVDIQLDPDERGFFKKIVSKKETYPDYFKGIITSISKNAKFDKKEKKWEVQDSSKNVISSIEGEFTNHLKFDDKTYWEYKEDVFPPLKRMAFTLPSDSTFREDLIFWMKKDEDNAQRFKVKLEEIQRKDRKLRENYMKTKKKK